MMAASGWDWLFVIGGAAIALPSFATLIFSFLGDRARGRARCPKCWYSLAGLVAQRRAESKAGKIEDEDVHIRCPECGKAVRNQHRLYRTRRRWRTAVLAAAFIALGACTTLVPKLRRDGPMSLIPTAAIIELMPIGGLDGPFGQELLHRAGFPTTRGFAQPTITPDQQIALARRIARGNILARPIDERWQRSYGAFMEEVGYMMFRLEPWESMTFRDRSPATPELREAIEEMLDIPPVLHVRSRDRWVEGLPIFVEMEVEHWWPGGYNERVDGTWATEDGRLSGSIKCKGGMDFEVPATGHITLSLDLRVMQSPYTDRDNRRELLATNVRLEYETVPTHADAISAVTSEELDAHLASTLAAWWDGQGTLNIDPTATAGPLVEDVGFGVTAEILHNGRVLAWHKIRWLEEGTGLSRGSSKGPITRGMETPDDNWREIFRYIYDNHETGLWQVRLRPLPEWALHMIDAKRYWAGEPVTIPIQFGDRYGNRIRPPP